MSEVRRFVDANLPTFKSTVTQDEELEELYRKLEQAMGGEAVKRKIAWPVVLLLASRK